LQLTPDIIYAIFETQTMKLFTVSEMTFNGHSRS